MDINQTVFSDILSSAIRNTDPHVTFDQLDFEYLSQISKNHDVFSLIYPTLKKICVEKDDAILCEWKKNTQKLAINQKVSFDSIIRTINTLTQAGIDVVVLKGIILRDLYPYPNLRKMCDADILVKHDDANRSKKILMDLGFTIENFNNKHVVFSKENSIPIELHTSLVDEPLSKKSLDWEKNIWANIVPIESKEIIAKTLSIEDNLIFLFVHLANHTITTGFGLRQLCDLVLYIEAYKNKIDWSKINNQLDKLGIRSFASIILATCSSIYNTEISDFIKLDNQEIDSFIDYIFKGGIFGSNETSNVLSGIYISNMREKLGNKLPNTFIRSVNLVFPSFYTMKQKYKYISKLPILLPISWIHRLLRNMINGSILYYVRLRVSLKKTNSIFDERYKLLKYLGLL